jgi:predicted dehydrogenase
MSVHVGIIGGGGIASHHIRGYRQAGASILMVSDAQADVARRRAAELGCDWSTDYRDLLRRADIQAVSVCVPNWLHYEVALAAVEAGKAVLCEKPMAVSLEQAEALVHRVQERGTFFQVGYMKRFHPVMRKFKELIPQIGPVEMGLLRSYQPFPERLWTAPDFWFTTKARSGGGPLVHGGSHMLDLLHWCLGDVTAVDARVRQKPGTDVDWHTSAILEMANGATVLFENGWFEHTNWGPKDDGWDEMFQLRGAAGVVTLYPAFWDRPTALVPTLQLYTQESHITQTFAEGPADYFVEEIKEFVQKLAAGQTPAVTVQDGYWVDHLIHAIYLSGEQQKRLVLG